MKSGGIKELKELLRVKNYLIEICLPCGKKHGKYPLHDIRQLYGDLETFIKNKAGENEKEAIWINLYAPNGSSFKRKGRYELFLNENTPPVPFTQQHLSGNNSNFSNTSNRTYTSELNKKPMETHHTTNRETPQEHHPSVPLNKTLITKSDIDAVQLRTENKYLSEKTEELKLRNKELERRNDELYNENLRLTRENATEKDKRDLEFKHKELDLIAKQKQGLSGIMEDVKTLPPEAWQFIAGLLPNHPMAKGFSSAELPPADPALNGTTKHADPDAQACLEVMNALLVKQTPEIVGMAALLTEHLANNPPVLKAVYEKFFPEQKAAT